MSRRITNLSKYQHAMKKAKQFKASATDIGDLYENYVKEYYSVSKTLRKGGVKVSKGHKQGLFQQGKSFEGWERADVLTVKEFKRLANKYSGLSVKELVGKQYNLMSEDLALKLQKELKDAGLGDYDISLIRARQLPDKVWKKMEEIALNKGTTISQYFFGSL